MKNPKKALLFTSLIGVSLLYFFGLNHLLQDIGDSVQYILLGKSLAVGEGYRSINYPGHPLHTDYPPLFPLILAPVIKIFGHNLLALKVVGILFTLATLWFASPNFLFLVWLGLSPYLLLSAHKIQSEPVFMFFGTIVLFLCCRMPRKAWLVGICCALAFLSRKVGLLLIPSVVVAWLLGSEKPNRREWIEFLLCALVPVILWILRDKWVAGSAQPISYIQVSGDAPGEWAQRIGTAGRNAKIYAATISQMMIPPLAQLFMVTRIWILFPLALLVAGMIQAWKKQLHVTVIFFVLYALLMTWWPWNTQRFWTPIIPLLYLFMFLALRPFLNGRLATAFMLLIIAIQIPDSLSLAASIRKGDDRIPEYATDYMKGLDWIELNIPKDRIVCAPEERLLTFISGQEAVGYFPIVRAPNQTVEYLKSNHASYLVYDSKYLLFQQGRMIPDPTLERKDCFREQFRSGTFALYEVEAKCQ